jgi:hypothetical protein
MNKTELRNFFRPIVIVFIAINAISLGFSDWLDSKGINHLVLMWGNMILFLITLISCFIHIRALASSNPHAFVRGVMLASFIKLIAIAVSVLIYLVAAGKDKSVYAVAVAMLFYIVYTLFEVKGAMNINQKRNAKD